MVDGGRCTIVHALTYAPGSLREIVLRAKVIVIYFGGGDWKAWMVAKSPSRAPDLGVC